MVTVNCVTGRKKRSFRTSQSVSQTDRLAGRQADSPAAGAGAAASTGAGAGAGLGAVAGASVTAGAGFASTLAPHPMALGRLLWRGRVAAYRNAGGGPLYAA